MVNNSEVENQINLIILSKKQFKQYLYVDEERIVDGNHFLLPLKEGIEIDKSITINISSNSFILLTSLKH